MIRRRLFNFVAGVCFPLCMATATIYVASFFGDLCFYRGTWERGDEIHIARGAIALELLTIGHPHPEWKVYADRSANLNVTATDTADRPNWRVMGFEASPDVNLYAIPLWSVLVLTGIIPAVWFLVRSSDCISNHCTTCRYNLTGNISGTCPECGAPVSPKPEHIA